MSSSQKTNKRTFYPPRTFEQDLQTFVQLASEQGWHFSGVDLDQLARDAVEQARERAAFDEAEAQFLATRERFALGQDSRYRRFAAALNAARAAFLGNEPVAQQLERFKRPNPGRTAIRAVQALEPEHA